MADKPIIDRSPSISKSASDNGNTARLYCRAQATNVSFTWSREGQPVSSEPSTIGQLAKYVVEATTQLDLVTYQSVLVITGVQSSDYGSYECLARNDMGFDAITVQLNRTSRPDPPLALRVLNITAASVHIRWIPGFDGGLDQSFRVRYRPTASADPSYSYRDVYPTNSTQMVINGLNEDTEYVFAVQAINEKGQSDYTADLVKATTLKGRALDIQTFVFYIKHLFIVIIETPVTETEKIISKVLQDHVVDIPKLIVIVSLVGSGLLLFNIVSHQSLRFKVSIKA